VSSATFNLPFFDIESSSNDILKKKKRKLDADSDGEGRGNGANLSRH
jgi:hypothetical protein